MLINNEHSLLSNRLRLRYIGETVASCQLGIQMWIGRRQFTSTSSSTSLTTLSPWQSAHALAPRTYRCCAAIHRLVLLNHFLHATFIFMDIWNGFGDCFKIAYVRQQFFERTSKFLSEMGKCDTQCGITASQKCSTLPNTAEFLKISCYCGLY